MTSLEEAIRFGSEYLCLKQMPKHVILPYHQRHGWLALCAPVGERFSLLFNGHPSPYIVFHELVHVKQFERGDQLGAVYAKMRTFDDYWSCSYEEEARGLGQQIADAYSVANRS